MIAVREPSELIRSLFHRGESLREVSIGYCLHAPVELVNRAADGTREPDCNESRQQERDSE